MDFTHELSVRFSVLPFEIMKQDKDEVIMLINYYIEKAENEPAPAAPTPANAGDGQQRRHVNNKTATGGWW